MFKYHNNCSVITFPAGGNVTLLNGCVLSEPTMCHSSLAQLQEFIQHCRFTNAGTGNSVIQSKQITGSTQINYLNFKNSFFKCEKMSRSIPAY